MTGDAAAWVGTSLAEPLTVSAGDAERVLETLPEGWTLTLVGLPPPLAPLRRQVRLLIGPAARREGRTLRYLAWRSAAQPALFPRLEGYLSVREAGEGCFLEVRARYRPPLGSVGQLADRAVLHLVAAASIRRFARELAARMAESAGQGPSKTGPGVPVAADAARTS